jgi:hypothetical protein
MKKIMKLSQTFPISYSLVCLDAVETQHSLNRNVDNNAMKLAHNEDFAMFNIQRYTVCYILLYTTRVKQGICYILLYTTRVQP